MIYIFKGIQGFFSLPGLLCKAVGDLCGKIHCDACKDCCLELSTGVRQFMGKPLSTYLVYAWIISGLEIHNCLRYDEKCEFTEESQAYVSLAGWRGIQMLFATLNIVFAPYMQVKLWKYIMQEVKKAPPPVDPITGKQVVPKKDVQTAFKKVFCEDFGVLFYFIAIILSVWWGVKGQEWGRNLRGDCSIDTPAWLGYALFALTSVYTFCWYCCPCCAKAIELEKQEDGYYDDARGSDSESSGA